MPNPGAIHGLHTPATTSVCAPRTRNNEHSLKIKHSQKNTNRHTRYSLTQKDDSTHTHSSYLSRKSKTQRYHNVTHSLVRRKADIRDAFQTGNTRNDNSNTHKQPHQLQNKNQRTRRAFTTRTLKQLDHWLWSSTS